MRYVAFVLSMILLSGSVAAVSEAGKGIEEQLSLAEKDMHDMQSYGLFISRYNDTLLVADELFRSQLAVEDSGGRADYSFVEEKLGELLDIKQKAYLSMDALTGLGIAMNQTEGIDLAPVLEIYGEARAELESERYEECLALVDRAYEKISELEAIETKIVAFYQAAGRGVFGFLLSSWKEIASMLAAVMIITVLSYNRVAMVLLRRKIDSINIRKESVRNLIKQAQSEYFEKGRISESSYLLRTKKFSEIIRDLNRQVPLLKEELAIRMKRKI